MNHSLRIVAGKWSSAPRRREARRFPALRGVFLNLANRSLFGICHSFLTIDDLRTLKKPCFSQLQASPPASGGRWTTR